MPEGELGVPREAFMDPEQARKEKERREKNPRKKGGDTPLRKLFGKNPEDIKKVIETGELPDEKNEQ